MADSVPPVRRDKGKAPMCPAPSTQSVSRVGGDEHSEADLLPQPRLLPFPQEQDRREDHGDGSIDSHGQGGSVDGAAEGLFEFDAEEWEPPDPGPCKAVAWRHRWLIILAVLSLVVFIIGLAMLFSSCGDTSSCSTLNNTGCYGRGDREGLFWQNCTESVECNSGCSCDRSLCSSIGTNIKRQCFVRTGGHDEDIRGSCSIWVKGTAVTILAMGLCSLGALVYRACSKYREWKRPPTQAEIDMHRGHMAQRMAYDAAGVPQTSRRRARYDDTMNKKFPPVFQDSRRI